MDIKQLIGDAENAFSEMEKSVTKIQKNFAQDETAYNGYPEEVTELIEVAIDKLEAIKETSPNIMNKLQSFSDHLEVVVDNSERMDKANESYYQENLFFDHEKDEQASHVSDTLKGVKREVSFIADYDLFSKNNDQLDSLKQTVLEIDQSTSNQIESPSNSRETIPSLD